MMQDDTTPAPDTALEPLDVAPKADALANEVSSLCGQLTPRQARYLGHLVTTQVVSESAKAAGVATSTVRSRRRTEMPGFREAERLAREAGGDLSKRFALAMLNGFLGLHSEGIGRSLILASLFLRSQYQKLWEKAFSGAAIRSLVRSSYANDFAHELAYQRRSRTDAIA